MNSMTVPHERSYLISLYMLRHVIHECVQCITLATRCRGASIMLCDLTMPRHHR